MTALCEILNIPRFTFYYTKHLIVVDAIAENAVIEVFKNSHGVYGIRKIKAVLTKQGIVLSRRRIGCIIRKFGLVSKSYKGCPYDNAVAEATFKIIKVEFVHGTPDYMIPKEYRLNMTP